MDVDARSLPRAVLAEAEALQRCSAAFVDARSLPRAVLAEADSCGSGCQVAASCGAGGSGSTVAVFAEDTVRLICKWLKLKVAL